jgi:hypothetical protein
VVQVVFESKTLKPVSLDRLVQGLNETRALSSCGSTAFNLYRPTARGLEHGGVAREGGAELLKGEHLSFSAETVRATTT